MLTWTYTERGQGIDHGVGDVSSLVTNIKSALADHSRVKDAVKVYNIEMTERAGDNVITPKENTECYMTVPGWWIMQKGGGLSHVRWVCKVYGD